MEVKKIRKKAEKPQIEQAKQEPAKKERKGAWFKDGETDKRYFVEIV